MRGSVPSAAVEGNAGAATAWTGTAGRKAIGGGCSSNKLSSPSASPINAPSPPRGAQSNVATAPPATLPAGDGRSDTVADGSNEGENPGDHWCSDSDDFSLRKFAAAAAEAVATAPAVVETFPGVFSGGRGGDTITTESEGEEVSRAS